MPRLRLETATDAIDLNDISATGKGVEALAGITGLGLPPVTVQWSEGAGDGAIYRGRRVQPREIDIPIYADGEDRDGLKLILSRLARMMSGVMRLWFIEDDGSRWYTDVVRVGGGQYSYGFDTTGERELVTVFTLRAGDPFWTSEESDQRVINRATTGRGLILDTVGGSTGADSLVKLRVSSAQVQGTVILENTGDAEAFPTWEIQGPGSNIVATGPNGETWQWNGSLLLGQTLFIDSRTATAIDNLGASRYDDFDTSPRFWLVPPGITSASITMTGTGRIVMSWKRRKWAVI